MFNQIPYMMANPMYSSAPLLNAASLSSAPQAISTATKATSLLSKINLSSILTNTQKTLNVVNQAIPLYYQVKPVFKNIKTLGKIGKEFMKNDNNNNNNIANAFINTQEEIEDKKTLNDDIPVPNFFI